MELGSRLVLVSVMTLGCGGDSSSATADAGVTDAANLADADPAAVDAGVDPGAEYIFADDALRTYELSIAEVDWQWLNDNALLEQYVPATLLFEGVEYASVAVRYKGGFGTLQGCFDPDTGARRCAKLSFKVKFNEYDPEARFFGLKKLNFHSMISDRSAMHDRLAYSLYREMGVAAPRAVHARLIVNGELMGLFALIEQIDGRFTRSRFTDGGEGNLYKEVWPVHSNPAVYLNALKTNEDESPSVDKMVRFSADLRAASAGTIADVLAGWTDLDNLIAYLAVDRAIENWDGIVGFWCSGGFSGNHNYYWYEETTRDQVWLIPWDLDNTFHVPNQFTTSYGAPAWDEVPASCDCVPIFEIDGQQIGRRPAACDDLIGWMGGALRARYIAATESLLAGPYQLAALNDKLDRWTLQIADAVAEDRNGPMVSNWQAEVADLRVDLATLRGQLEAVVAE